MSNQDTSTTLPFAGRTFLVSYGDHLTALNIYADDGKTMRYEVTEGPFKGATAEVVYEALQVGDGTYVLSWQEADKGTVVHLDDFSAGTSRAFYTTATHEFVRMLGSLVELA
ncbi:MoaF-related domain-containing protein [Paraburkholderia fungorum]|uniref:Adenylate cyclase n=1 Tax=Paraburkholderia fungorum TaxID=134537 RepID=A0A420GXS8_9BURK|nr:adenylate cyclase [Paraburkholderia fungorum]RKF49883.1 adenylate cyclase [Paraburkholderia fungorum]